VAYTFHENEAKGQARRISTSQFRGVKHGGQQIIWWVGHLLSSAILLLSGEDANVLPQTQMAVWGGVFVCFTPQRASLLAQSGKDVYCLSPDWSHGAEKALKGPWFKKGQAADKYPALACLQ